MNYENYMKKCIELAKNGEGQTSPNPMVGCVVLDKNENEISELKEKIIFPYQSLDKQINIFNKNGVF